jgi:cyclic beta-1,2-glucan synthetase
MIWAPFISFLLICILILANFIWWEIALPFILLWAASPLLIWALHEYRHVPEAKIITASDRAFFRQLARRTWRYFDDNVTEEFSSLPPAYTLEQPHAANARYTTPAAIGYWLSSLASAQDFGFITPQQFITRASATLDTIGEGLRQEGHLLNQYTIENLAPCEPRVISSSESAALITSLWVFIEACNEMIDKPIIDATALQGLADTVTMLKEASKDAKELSGPVITLTTIFNDAPDDLDKIVQRIKLAVRPTKQLIESLKTENSPHGPALYWAEKLQSQLAMWVSYIDLYLPWVNFLKAATSDSMVMMDPACSALRDQLLLSGISLNALAQKKMLLLSRLNSMGSRTKWDMHICNQFDESSNAANAIIDQLRKLISVAENYAQAIDMKVFHNSENNLLSQHYDISKKKAGPPVRDFLISESRLSSFIAIAHSDVPVKHWPNLIKAYHSLNGKRTLLSLNGAINDYLAPFLFMKNYDHSEIEEAARTALKCQIDYALERNIPWGIAKTAYVSDNELQFETNGISGLGVKCDTSTKTTISPYSTLLALAIYPALAIKNLKNLVNLNMLGEKGFYESISFAESDSDADSTNEITYLYTAEHQGINLISINNALHNNVMQTRFHKNLRVRTHQALLFTQKQPAYSPTHWGFFPAFSWFTTLAFKPV